jgi:MFS family permease
MLLPSMAADLGLGYARMGLIGTANFVGYLIAVLASGMVAARVGPRRMVAAALLLAGASLSARRAGPGVLLCCTFSPAWAAARPTCR